MPGPTRHLPLQRFALPFQPGLTLPPPGALVRLDDIAQGVNWRHGKDTGEIGKLGGDNDTPLTLGLALIGAAARWTLTYGVRGNGWRPAAAHSNVLGLDLAVVTKHRGLQSRSFPMVASAGFAFAWKGKATHFNGTSASWDVTWEPDFVGAPIEYVGVRLEGWGYDPST